MMIIDGQPASAFPQPDRRQRCANFMRNIGHETRRTRPVWQIRYVVQHQHRAVRAGLRTEATVAPK